MGLHARLMSRSTARFRKAIPDDIRPKIENKREIKFSLRKVPESERPDIIVKLDGLCDEAFRNARSGKPFTIPTIDTANGRTTIKLVGSAEAKGTGHAPAISELFDLWRKQTPDASASSIREWERSARYFIDLMGDIPADTVTKKMVLEFKEALRLLPKNPAQKYPGQSLTQLLTSVKTGKLEAELTLSETSINKYLTGLSAIFEVARNADYVTSNPFSGQKTAIRHSRNDRKAFSQEDLQKLFAQPIFTKKETDNLIYWFMLLGLYTSARLTEILQLRTNDIRRKDDIWYIDINREDGKQLKSASSVRKIPIHHDLLELGFIEYVDSLKASGKTALFPIPAGRTLDQYSATLSKRLNAYINSCGLTDNKKVFHSLRHTFRDMTALHDVPEDICEALMGHSNNKVNRNYGSGQFIERLDKYIQGMQFLETDKKQAKAIKVRKQSLSVSELFSHTPRLEIREVSALLAPELSVAESSLIKILCYQLSKIRFGEEEPSMICSPDALVTEPELQQALQAAKLLS